MSLEKGSAVTKSTIEPVYDGPVLIVITLYITVTEQLPENRALYLL